MRATLFSIITLAALSLTACAPAEDAPVVTAGWECSPDASSRYRVDDDGMKLELCSAGCAVEGEHAICAG